MWALKTWFPDSFLAAVTLLLMIAAPTAILRQLKNAWIRDAIPVSLLEATFENLKTYKKTSLQLHLKINQIDLEMCTPFGVVSIKHKLKLSTGPARFYSRVHHILFVVNGVVSSKKASLCNLY
ncbi:hypothetical protein GQX74_011738 [Glossina fuscipes]|nr:hypothetical protein GQX74_011738 [Glossina fuscipes]